MKKLPDLGHVGYIVEDVDKSAAWYGALLNTEFYIYDFSPLRAWVNGREVFDVKLRIGMGLLENGQKIELIQPISGDNTPHMRFLREKGENVHHIAFQVREYEEWRDYFTNTLHADILFEAEVEDEVIGYRRSFYASTEMSSGVIEVSEIPRKR